MKGKPNTGHPTKVNGRVLKGGKAKEIEWTESVPLKVGDVVHLKLNRRMTSAVSVFNSAAALW